MFLDKALKKYRKYLCFLHFLLPALKANRLNTGICSVLTRQNAKKNTMFGNNFSRFFGPCPSGQKSVIFYPIFATAHPTQEGVKSQKIAKLDLKSTFFMSQSLSQSSRAKKWGRLFGPQNAVNYDVF